MSTQATAHNGATTHELGDWRDATRVFLQPIAAPSILGLFGFAGATFMVAAYLAHWYGDALSLNYIWPFAATFGGIAQFAAALWGYRARDGLATAMHGMWGAFWMGFGILFLTFVLWWLLASQINIHLPTAGLILATGLILFGVLGLLGSLRPRRSTDPVSGPPSDEL